MRMSQRWASCPPYYVSMRAVLADMSERSRAPTSSSCTDGSPGFLSLLSRFDRDAHPALDGSLVVPLSTFHIKYRDYTDSDNPPILHRKEEFVSADYPLRSRFASLTRQEKAKRLYATTARIGTREEWGHLLMSAGFSCRGHRLVAVPRNERSS